MSATCNHANEVPMWCPCESECTCKTTMCKAADVFSGLLSGYLAALELSRFAHNRVEELRRAIAPLCKHPAEHVQDRSWHHGYGKYVTGERCSICLSTRSWKGRGAWASLEEQSKWGREDQD